MGGVPIRGFSNFNNVETTIYFHCGDIDLLPVTDHPVEPENLLWRR
jgi:hypothetical protein